MASKISFDPSCVLQFRPLTVSVNSFPVTPFLMGIQAVTGLSVLVRRPVSGFVTGLLVLFHFCSHFVLLLDS